MMVNEWSRTHILGWMKDRSDRVLNVATAKCWRLHEINVGIRDQGNSSERVEVRRLLLAFGSKGVMRIG